MSSWTRSTGVRTGPCPREEFRTRVAEALSGDSWVIDGNYSKVRDIVRTRADTLIWLDYALPLILRQLLARTARRAITGEPLWSGNRERFAAIFSRAASSAGPRRPIAAVAANTRSYHNGRITRT